MELKQESFKVKLAFGKEGEHEVGEYMLNKGYSILPLYQFNDDVAPQIFNAKTTITSPDLFVCGNNKYFWVEVKTKNRWIKYLADTETGCNYKHYIEYLKIAEITGLPVYIIFNHKDNDPRGFYSVNIKVPLHRIWDGLNCKTGARVSQPLALWLIKDLIKLAT